MSNQILKMGLEKQRNQKKYLIRLTILFLVIGFLTLLYWFSYSRHYETTDNAYVNGKIIPVTSQIGGTIIEVKVNDTDFVTTGEPLVILDPSDRKIALEEAQANLALTLRQTKQLYIEDKALKATIQARKLTLEQASFDLKRRQQAIHVGGISQEELTHAQDRFNIANSLLTTATAKWNANRALISNTSIEQHPRVLQAITNFKRAYLAYKRTIIKAPYSGYVAKRSAHIGQTIAPGTFLLAVVPLDDIWVDANFKERQLHKMKPGQTVTLEADIHGSSIIYHGQVAGFSGGTGSAFSLLPAQNATGNWIKVVQRLPVRIYLDANEVKEHPLQIGLSMEVRVDTSSVKKVLKNVAEDVANQTAIFNGLEKGADKIIAKIFKDNLANSTKPETGY